MKQNEFKSIVSECCQRRQCRDLVIVLISITMLSSCTCLWRSATLLNADVYDYKHLPVKTIPNSPETFHFQKGNANSLNLDDFQYNNLQADSFEALLEENHTNAFLIIRNDSLLYENYFNGHSRDSYCKVFSITKNVLSTLIGIALEEGHITSLDDPLTKYIPEMKDDGMSEVSLYHLMNGTAGIRYKKNYFPWSDEAKMYYKPNIRKHLSSIQLVTTPGNWWRTENYSPQLLGVVLERATGKTISAYLEEKLWIPLQTEYPALFVTDSKKHGFEKTESGLVLRAIDLARFGRLCLHEGNWNGRQILPEGWMMESVNLEEKDSLGITYQEGVYKEYYKHFWWCFSLDGETVDRYSANGHFGQRLYVSPHRNLIVIRLGSKNGDVNWGAFCSKLIRYIDSL